MVEEEEATGCGSFLFNAKEGTVLGRNASSWFKVLCFYTIYYSCLAFMTFHSVSIYRNYMVVMPGEKNARPTTQNRISTPGVGAFPATEKLVIDANRVSTFEYIDAINNKVLNYAENNETRSVLTNLGECSPICSESGDQGCKMPPLRQSYSTGNPCVFYQVNKVIGWKPFPLISLDSEYVTPRNAATGGSMVGSVVEKFNPEQIYFYCYDLDLEKGYTNATDRFTVSYYSSDNANGASQDYGTFSFAHWPIESNQVFEKVNPFVAVKYNINPDYQNELINVACQSYAANIGPNEKTNQGYNSMAITVASAGQSTISQINNAFQESE